MFSRFLTLEALAVVLLLSLTRSALAEQLDVANKRADCKELSWPVENEKAWFSSEALARRPSGARLRKIDRAVDLLLEPRNQVPLFLPPEVRPKGESNSGEVTFFGVPKPGLYQVTISDDASVDVFENGFRVKAAGSTSSKDCPGVFKSVRYELAEGTLVLVEITNASKRSIKVAFAKATQ